MATNVTASNVDEKEVERAVGMWNGFMRFFKYGTVSIIVLLILMSWFLL